MPIRGFIDWAKAKLFVQQAAEATMSDVAVFIAAQARSYCPVDTGVLQSSITVISSLAGAKWSVVATAPYAQWVEFGHYSIAGTFIPPNPFMRRAMADGIQKFPQIAQSSTHRPGLDGSRQNLGIDIK